MTPQREVFRGGTVFDGTDPNATGLTFAHLVARLTEQTLRKL